MCGINGYIDFRKKYTKEQRHTIVHRMNDRIMHRGPDGEGILDEEWFSMGMRRLAIVDLKTGDQPIYNEDKSKAVVFNGEIYNYRALKEDLVKRGHVFNSNSDTEVIVHLFEEYGTDSFDMLDGMFAFSLYDSTDQSVFLVRDRIGEKPLYYSWTTDHFCFASEMKSILCVDGTCSTIDKSAFEYYFQYIYIPSPYTVYEEIRKVEPGHYIQIRADGEVIDKTYWQMPRIEDFGYISYGEAKEILRKLLSTSVRERMNCDVPFGAFLSGGIDSSVIAALMTENSSKPIKTFTIGFEEKEYDESKNARTVAEYLGTEHHEAILSYKNSIDIVKSVIDGLDEPFADSSAIPQYLVSRFASDYVKVVLTGDAGDEMFLGYDKYAINYYVDKYEKIPGCIRAMTEGLVNLMPDRSVISRKVNKVLSCSQMSGLERRKKLMQHSFKMDEIKRLIKDPDDGEAKEDLVTYYYNNAPRDDELGRTQYTDIRFVLEGDMLTKVDRMTMMNSIESRTPMLAKDIVEFAYNIPQEYKLQGNNKKRILKEAFSDKLPKGLDKLPKKGFGVPIDHWFRNEMREEIGDILSHDRIKRQGLFDAEYIEEILKQHFSGIKNRKNEIWTLYVFEKWFEAQT